MNYDGTGKKELDTSNSINGTHNVSNVKGYKMSEKEINDGLDHETRAYLVKPSGKKILLYKDGYREGAA